MAWPTTRQPTDALTYEFVPELWSARVINHVRSYLISMQVVNTNFRDQLSMGDKLYIPVLKELSGAAVDPAITSTSAYTNMNTTIGTTTATVTIDHWWEVPVALDDSVARQTQVGDLLGQLADNAAYALEKKIDTEVCALFDDLGGYSSTAYGSDGQTFTDDLLITLMETLDELDVPTENRVLVGDPSVLADCFKIDKFMSYDYTKNPLGGVNPVGGTGGYRGTIVPYQLPLYITNHLTDMGTGNCGCLLHRDAIGLVIQSGPDVERWRAPERHAWIVNVSAMWGEDELRDTFGIPFYTRSD